MARASPPDGARPNSTIPHSPQRRPRRVWGSHWLEPRLAPFRRIDRGGARPASSWSTRSAKRRMVHWGTATVRSMREVTGVDSDSVDPSRGSPACGRRGSSGSLRKPSARSSKQPRDTAGCNIDDRFGFGDIVSGRNDPNGLDRGGVGAEGYDASGVLANYRDLCNAGVQQTSYWADVERLDRFHDWFVCISVRLDKCDGLNFNDADVTLLYTAKPGYPDCRPSPVGPRRSWCGVEWLSARDWHG